MRPCRGGTERAGTRELRERATDVFRLSEVPLAALPRHAAPIAPDPLQTTSCRALAWP